MRINVTSVLVNDQDKALRFYTEVLGFVKKTEIPLGEARWLTVVSPEETRGRSSARAGRTPRRKTVQAGARRGRNTLYLVRRRRH